MEKVIENSNGNSMKMKKSRRKRCCLPKKEENDVEFDLHDEKGFTEHCKVVELIMREMNINPHTKHHIRAAVREASNKVTTTNGSEKDRAEYMSKSACTQMESGDFAGLTFEHGVPVSYMNELVLNLKHPTYENIGKIIRDWTVLAVITKSEHDELSKLA